MVFAGILAFICIASANHVHGAAGIRVIGSSGESLGSMFDGLRPTVTRVAPSRGESHRQRLSHDRPLLNDSIGARYVPVQCCTNGQCFGHYEKIIPCHGCCTDPSCEVDNYQYDPAGGLYSNGAADVPCGADCCDDWAICPRP